MLEMHTTPRLHQDAFYGMPGRVVSSLEPHTEADSAALLITLLAVAGNAVGGGPHALADGSRHPAKLNVLLVGSTSRGRKGSSWAQVRSVMRHADPGWFNSRITGGLASGEGLIAQVADGRDSPDRRLLVFEPEFARVLTAAGRDGSTLSHVIREAWDSDTIRLTTRHDPLAATDAHVSVLAHITAEELQHRLTRTDQANGFANRFLFVWVERARLLPEGGNPDPDLYSRLGSEVRARLEAFRRLNRFVRTPDATELWAELYQQMAEQAPAGMLGAITGRAEAQVLRLSLLYSGLDGTPKVDVSHIKAAWAVWQYCEATAAYLFQSTTGNQVADKLLNALRDAWRKKRSGLDRSQMYQLFARHVRQKDLDEAILILEELGLAESTQAHTAGRARVVTFYCEMPDAGGDGERSEFGEETLRAS